MTEETKVDRGDDFVATSDESGETDDQTKEVKDVKEESDDAGKEEISGEDKSKESEDAADKGEDADKKKDIRIPKERFDQAVAKARKETEAERARAAELQEKLDAMQGAADTDKIEEKIDKLEDELEGAIKDGNVDKKLRLRKEIRKLNQEIAETKAAQHAARATAVAIERITYDSLVKETEAAHPELNPDDEGYDQEVVDELNEYKEAFEAKGHGSTESLRKALRAIYGKAPAKAEKVEDKEDNKTDEQKKAAEEAGAKRKEEAVKKGLEIKGKQPADSKKAGLDSDKAGKKSVVVDVSKLTNAEFDKLSEDELKRARGDIL